MSLMMMTEAFKKKVGNPARKLVLVKLADNANDQGECWPSYGHIAEECEMGRSTVKAHIKALADAGYLTIQIRRRGEQNASNMYKLTLDQGKETGRAKPSRPGKSKAKIAIDPGQPLIYSPGQPLSYPGQILTHPRSAVDLPPGQPLTPEPVIKNLSLNQSVNHSCATALRDAFEVFYSAGLPKKSRKRAETAFKTQAKRQSNPLEFAHMLAANITSRLGTGELGFDAMHPATYLNQQRWLDDVPERCPHAAILAAWNEEMPAHIEKISADDWTPESRGFQALASAWENFKTKPRASTGKPVFTEEQEGIEFYREVFRRLAKVDRVQGEDAFRWCRLSWAAQQQVTVQIFKGEVA
ncbi:helix-turn-helix domain-containing protein [Halomonas sp. OfavH-34-E]|uniref:helix-turn-helix domain-containing protein n=1 Tax=Halomonas sp. OfavH-34-E TaxID=2954491 RepID=UPI00209834CB|nr:helix-turn-helix domain-containing protein [Halomonas sp. OfavH-34-E]MCO7217869.1 helix-turn-helix domain-containing protein [Halomonas sp. OfavH-34-E]